MGVYIKGMEMPTSCGDCRFCGGIAYTDCGPCAWCEVDGKARVADTRQDCPLVHVPPHGDLIDRDELVKLCDPSFGFVWRHDIIEAPTIIEAEG